MLPLLRGVWILVDAAYQIVLVQTNLDKHIKTLINLMDDVCGLAKDYTPLKGRHSSSDTVVRDIWKEVIKGANIVKLYCEKRPSGVYLEHPLRHETSSSETNIRPFEYSNSRFQPSSRGDGMLRSPFDVEWGALPSRPETSAN